MDNVDYTRQTADGPGDDDQAERIVKALRQIPGLEYMEIWKDPQKLKRFTDEMRASLSGYDTTQAEDARLRQESPEKPFSSDEFWNSDEPKKQFPRKL
jgi:hypothetical protein